MVVFSPHAIREMLRRKISLEEALHCLNHGELIIRQNVKGETRYGKRIELRDKTILVIYVHENTTTKVITCYPIKRKRKW